MSQIPPLDASTPLPWVVGFIKAVPVVRSLSGVLLATVHVAQLPQRKGLTQFETAFANAKLMSYAPLLRDAMREALEHLDDLEGSGTISESKEVVHTLVVQRLRSLLTSCDTNSDDIEGGAQ